MLEGINSTPSTFCYNAFMEFSIKKITKCSSDNHDFVYFITEITKTLVNLNDIRSEHDDVFEHASELGDVFHEKLLPLFPGRTMDEPDFSTLQGEYKHILIEIYKTLLEIWKKNEMEDFPHEDMRHEWTKDELVSDTKPLLNKLLTLQKKLSS